MMHLVDMRLLGIMILLLLSILVIVKRIFTGSILDRPKGDLMIQIVNIVNLFFLLVVNPLAAILLITGSLLTADPTHIVINESVPLKIFELVGLVLYVMGYLLMAWALMTLGRNYQLGVSNLDPAIPLSQQDLTKWSDIQCIQRH
jgi:protein-S-isoprenylcysteine O-methyltransferase Ste14